jgi:hypothetical protein
MRGGGARVKTKEERMAGKRHISVITEWREKVYIRGRRSLK